MIMLTSAENDILRPWLINRIQTGAQTINYKALAEELDPDKSLGWNDGGRSKGLSHALYHVANFEVEHSRPVGLVALVINKLRGTSGSGFAAMARGLPNHLYDVPEGRAAEDLFWRERLDEAIGYWGSHQDDPTADAQHAAVMAELREIKRMLRTLLHG